MRKGRDGEKKREKREKKKEKENTDENSGHYVIASSRPPESRPLECHTLAPKVKEEEDENNKDKILRIQRQRRKPEM